MKTSKTHPTERMEPRTIETTAERRRLQIVPSEHDTLSIKADDDTFNPYERRPVDRSDKPVKRDLRKLSEWIKALREMEEKKSRGED